MKRKLGVCVYQRTIEGKPYCIVEKGGRAISQQEDDVWGTLCMFVFLRLLRACYQAFEVLENYPPPPAYKFLPHFDVRALVDAFDFKNFEEKVLPKLAGKTNYDRVVKNWKIIKENNMMDGDVADLYEVYDWIIRLRVLMRGEKGDGHYVLPDCIRTDVEQLGAITTAKFALITSDALLPAYQAVHSTGTIVEHGGNRIFIANPSSCMTNVFGFQEPEELDINFDERPDECAYKEPEPVEAVSGDMTMKVITLLGRPRQKMTVADNEFLEHGGHPELLDASRGGFGKAALRGLRNAAGEGEVEECIQRLATHLSHKLPGTPIEHMMDFAAGKIAAMQGDYRANRTVGAEGKTTWMLTIKNRNRN